MVPTKSWGSHKSTNTVRVWRARVKIINFSKSTDINFAEARRLKNETFKARHDFINLFSRILYINTNNIIYLNLSDRRNYLYQWVWCYISRNSSYFLRNLFTANRIKCDFFCSAQNFAALHPNRGVSCPNFSAFPKIDMPGIKFFRIALCLENTESRNAS